MADTGKLLKDIEKLSCADTAMARPVAWERQWRWRTPELLRTPRQSRTNSTACCLLTAVLEGRSWPLASGLAQRRALSTLGGSSMAKVVRFQVAVRGQDEVARELRSALGNSELAGELCVDREDGDRARVAGLTVLISAESVGAPVETWVRTPRSVDVMGTVARGFELRGRAAGVEVIALTAPTDTITERGCSSVASALGMQAAVPPGHLVVELSLYLGDARLPTLEVKLAGIGLPARSDSWELTKREEVPRGRPRPDRPSVRDRSRALFVATEYGGGTSGDAALGVGDPWLDDLRQRMNKLLSVLGTTTLRSGTPSNVPKLVIPWFDRIDQQHLVKPDGTPLNLRSNLVTLLMLNEALKARTEVPTPTEAALVGRANDALDAFGTINADVPLFDFTVSDKLIKFAMWDIKLWFDFAKVSLTSIRTVPTGVEIAGTIRDFGGSALYSTVPPLTPEAVGLGLATLGVYAVLVSNAGPIGLNVRDVGFRLRLVPDPNGDQWSIVVDELFVHADLTAASVNLINLPLVFGINVFAAAVLGVERNLGSILTMLLTQIRLPLGWPAKSHFVDAPALSASRAGLYENVGTALQGSLSGFISAATGLPIGDSQRVFYAFNDSFLWAWLGEVCGVLKMRHSFTEGEVKKAGINIAKPKPAPPTVPLDVDDILSKLNAHPSGLPIGANGLPPPPPKIELRSSLVIDSFDLELVPRPDVAFRLVAISRLLIETVQITYVQQARVFPQKCAMRPPRGKLGGLGGPVGGPIAPIDPMGPMGRDFGGGIPGDFGGGISIELPTEFCNPPHVELRWTPVAKVVAEHVSATFRHSLDVQLGLQVDLFGQRPPNDTLTIADQLWFPRVAIRAPGPIVAQLTVKKAEPALDTPATWAAVTKLADAIFLPYLQRLLDAPEIVSNVPFLSYGQLGQPQGDPFVYRADGSTLVWDIDLTDTVTPLIP